MKQNLQFLLIAAITLIGNAAFAKTTSYNGSTWNNGVPSGSSDVVSITGGSYSLPANITYASLTLNGGNFNTNGRTFAVTTVTLTNGTFTGSANQTFGGTLTVNGGTYTLGSTTRVLTVNNLNVTSGTFTLPSNLTVNSTITLSGGLLEVNGRTVLVDDITFAGGNMNMGGATVNLGINSNISVTGTSSLISNGTGILNGTGGTLTVNGGVLTLNNSEVVIDNLIFNTSHDIEESNGGFLSFDASSGHTITSADNNSHVNSKVRLYTSSGNSNIFIFPIGNGTVYSPFIVNPTNVPNNGTNFTHYFEATYVGASSPNKALDFTTLNSASGYEYWIAASSSSNVNGTIGLRYDDNALKTGLSELNSTSNISTDLILAQYVNSQWSGLASSNSTTSGITTVLSSSTTISPNTSYTLASNNSRTTFVIPLPVILIDFNAIAVQNKSVNVTWSTSKEEFSNYFEVMRSTDGFNWKSIGIVQSTGTSNEVSKYSLTDDQPYSVNYYRLKEVAMNGAFSYSDIRIAKVTGLASKISFYPNPANQTLNVNCANLDFSNEVTIQLVNQMGQVVLVNKVDNMFATSFITSINIADLPAGIYQVSISNAGAEISEKLIINH